MKTSFACNCTVPSSSVFHLQTSHLRIKPSLFCLPKSQTNAKKTRSITLHPTSNCNDTNNNKNKEEVEDINKEQENYQTSQKKPHLYPNRTHILFENLHFSSERKATSNRYPETQKQEKEGRGESPIKKRQGLSTNMWWVDLKAALGQRINIEGIISSATVFVKDRHLALPHVSVPDIRYIDWAELSRRGFKGVVFDKDNTITVPYSLTLWDPLQSSIGRCKSVFGNEIAVFSNSAGLFEYDHDDSKARELEKAIGIKVIRHKVKKPAGTAEEIEQHFGYKSSQLIMVGDRPFTDIVYGNRNGFFTILTEPLILAGEPFIVQQVRKLEVSLINRWFRRGLKPISHHLLPNATECVKDLPPA